jgi:hypothetical protein
MTNDWLRRHGIDGCSDPKNPRCVLHWFHLMIPPKVHRALTGLTDDDPDLREWPADHDGSAKIALIGIDRSHAAWLQAVEQGVISHADVQPFIADLIWLGDALERVFPKARAFVRPGLDEPDEIAKLLAVEELGTSADSI